MTAGPAPTVPSPVRCAGGCARHRKLQPLVFAAWWLIAAGGALAVSALPLDPGEGMCGVWGCFPPFQALLAMHLLWAVAAGAAVHLVWAWQPALRRPVGGLLFAVAVAAAGWVVVTDLALWFERVSDGFHPYWPKRVAYTLATRIDVPVIQTAAAGAVLFVFGGRRAGSAASSPSGESS